MAGPGDLAFELAAVATRLREIGEGGLARELSRAIGKAADSIPKQVEAGLKPRLPDPYATALGEDLRFSRRTSTTGEEARVTVSVTTQGAKRRRLKRLDDGILAHPLWGNRRHWRDQQVQPGWFSGTAEDAAPQVREEIDRALHDVGEKAAGRGA